MMKNQLISAAMLSTAILASNVHASSPASTDWVRTKTATPCTHKDKRCGVFVTQMQMYGNMQPTNAPAGFSVPVSGGIAAGDAICNYEGNRAAPGTSWKAWLSTPAVNAGTRVLQTNTLYCRAGTMQCLGMGSSLIAGPTVTGGGIRLGTSLDSATNATNGANFLFWTGTDPNGDASGITCLGWTSNSGGENGQAGSRQDSGSNWTSEFPVGCDNPLPIACFQQQTP